MPFTEANAVEELIRDALAGPPPARGNVAESSGAYLTVGRSQRGAGWHFLPPGNLNRRPNDVLVEEQVRDALIRLNPTIAAQPERADEVLYKLRAHRALRAQRRSGQGQRGVHRLAAR